MKLASATFICTCAGSKCRYGESLLGTAFSIKNRNKLYTCPKFMFDQKLGYFNFDSFKEI